MHYRSYADLSRIVARGLRLVPRDVDLIVAIPRSGYVPAAMLALSLNRRMIDLPGFLAGRRPQNGVSRGIPSHVAGEEPRHILVVDDSVLTGHSLQVARRQITELGLRARVTYAAAFVTPAARDLVDIHFDICPFPRQFEWNVFHHEHLARACLDIDGVLCVDPTLEENDDADRYRDFLLNAAPHILPTYPIRHLVTSRLERWRPETEAWLKKHGVRYERLSMLDLPSAAERRRLGAHIPHKALTYVRDLGAKLFIESEAHQAQEIANRAGKPVLCIETQTMRLPASVSVASIAAQSVSTARSVARRVVPFLRRLRPLRKTGGVPAPLDPPLQA